MQAVVDTVVPDEAYLYLLVRNDLRSLNAGKAMAQAAHSANQFVYEYQQVPCVRWRAQFDKWATSAQTPNGPQGFGTTIVLAVSERELRSSIAIATLAGFRAGITHDPSYPLVDGYVAPVDTCGYVFGAKDDLFPILGRFTLYP